MADQRCTCAAHSSVECICGAWDSRSMTLADRIAELVAQHGSLRAAARVLECDAGYLSRLQSGEKDNPEDWLLRRMKLRRVVPYERTDGVGASEPPSEWKPEHLMPLPDLPADTSNVKASTRGEARRLVAECAPFLKEGETPAECIARNRKDAEAVFLYYNDAHRWRWVRDNWHEVSGRFYPVIGEPGPSWNRPNDPDALTSHVDEQRAAGVMGREAPSFAAALQGRVVQVWARDGREDAERWHNYDNPLDALSDMVNVPGRTYRIVPSGVMGTFNDQGEKR